LKFKNLVESVIEDMAEIHWPSELH